MTPLPAERGLLPSQKKDEGMMLDKNGAKLKVGDAVMLPGVIVSEATEGTHCMVQIELLWIKVLTPEGSKPRPDIVENQLIPCNASQVVAVPVKKAKS